MTDSPAELPTLHRPLGSLQHPLARPAAEAFDAVGRRARVTGTAGTGIDTVWAGATPVARGLRLQGADETAEPATESPLGVERILEVGGVAAVERVVVSRDAPVAWVEWMPTAAPSGDGDGSTGETVAAELTWQIPGGQAGTGWERHGRGLMVEIGGLQAFFLLSETPAAVSVEAAGPVGSGDPAAGALLVRVRAPFPVDPGRGLRLAVVGSGPRDDPDRLLRIAGRTAAAVPGRRGAAQKLLDDGLTVVSPAPELDDAVARSRLRFDATRIETIPGGWTLEAGVREALGRLAAGDFEGARSFLRVVAGDAAGADGGARPLVDFLVARYLAWSGDRAGVRSMGWGGAVEAEGDPDIETPSALGGVDADAAPVRRVVEELLGARPDALRGRLVLRPRPPEDWDRLTVRGLAVGGAAVDVAYRRDGSRHRFTLTQPRGAVPIQAVLEPELPGGRVRAARVDGKEAELDPVRTDGRWRVPVQLVLDAPRTLEVEFVQDTV